MAQAKKKKKPKKRRSSKAADVAKTVKAGLWLCMVESGPPRSASCTPIPPGDVAKIRKLFAAARARSGAAPAVSGMVAILQ